MEKQREIFRPNELQQKMFERKDDRLLLVRTPRRYGKTTGLLHLAFQYGVLKPNQRILALLPSQVMAKRFSESFNSILDQMPHIPRLFNWSTLGYKFGEGSDLFITCASRLFEGRMRGCGVDHLLLDEAAFIPEEVHKALYPIMMGDFHSGPPTVVMASTPNYSSNIFDRFCNANPECVLLG